MPFVLRHESTGEIAAAMLRNNYNFTYFGVKAWDSSEEAEVEREAFLAQWQYEEEPRWRVIEIDEGKLKTLNVKLKNNPAYMVTLDASGVVTAMLREEA
jgi:hypothetical protein